MLKISETLYMFLQFVFSFVCVHSFRCCLFTVRRGGGFLPAVFWEFMSDIWGPDDVVKDTFLSNFQIGQKTLYICCLDVCANLRD